MTKMEEYLDDFVFGRDLASSYVHINSNAIFRKELILHVASSNKKHAAYSSWILCHYFEHFPDSMSAEEYHFIVDTLITTKNHSVHRNACNCIVFANYDCSEDGQLLDQLFAFMADSDSLPALIYAASHCIEKHFLPKYPELMQELKNLYVILAKHEKPSMKAMARKFEKTYKKHPFYVA